MSEYVLELLNISKSFGDLKANDDITVRIKGGTIHALIGENGAGKSTLMNIVTNIHKRDRGTIKLSGQEIEFRNPMDVTKHGIGMVYQDFMLFQDLTVLENIIMGFEDRKAGIFLEKAAAKKRVEEICEQYHFELPLGSKVKDLPVAILQQVEIVKTLYRNANIIILDEPTSVLTPQGIQGLFRALRYLKSTGKTIIIITHKLDEVFAVADEITVLRDGKVVGHSRPSEINKQELANLMVGRNVILKARKVEATIGRPVLEVKNLNVKDTEGLMRVKNVSFTVHSGEIVGIAGVAGSGQTQLSDAIVGLVKPETGGDILFNGESLLNKDIGERRRTGMAHVPQNRMTEGINPLGAVWENAIMGYHIAHGFSSKIFLKKRETAEFTRQIIDEYSVVAQNINHRVTSLSGGNIQKLIVGREFIQENELLVIVDPTRGIDVGAIEFIWEKIIDLAKNGVAVLLISHELNEVMQLSDRILVMYNGTMFKAGAHGELTESEIGLLMAGGGSADETDN